MVNLNPRFPQQKYGEFSCPKCFRISAFLMECAHTNLNASTTAHGAAHWGGNVTVMLSLVYVNVTTRFLDRAVRDCSLQNP